MGKVLIIGAGGVGTVVAHKVAQNPDVFTDIMIASRTKSKCDAIVKAIGNPAIKTAQVDADNVDELVALFNSFKPEIVINVALPYQDLTRFQRNVVTAFQFHGADFWTFGIKQDSGGFTSFAHHVAQILNALTVFCIVTMREVQTHNVHASVQHFS